MPGQNHPDRKSGSKIESGSVQDKLLLMLVEDLIADKKRRHEQADRTLTMVMSALPVLMTSLLGDGRSPGGSKPSDGGGALIGLRDHAVGKILKNLSVDEVKAIMSSLQGENQIAFIELYKSFAEDFDAKKTAPPGPFARKPAVP